MRLFILVCLIFLVGVAWAVSPDRVGNQNNSAQVVERNNALLSPEQVLNFFDSFEAYTAGTQLALQNSVQWTTWSNAPGDPTEDPLVSNAQAYNGSNSVVLVQNNDLVKVFASSPITSGMWKISFQMYIPSGKAGYFNTLSSFAGAGSEWAMQVYFDVGGGARLDAGAASAATFTYAYDTWQLVEFIVDLNTDTAELYFAGSLVYTWQYTLGTFGTPIALQLDANDFFGATADDEMYFDDYAIEEIVPGLMFSDNFDGYIAGTHLALQNPVFWTTWSGTPGGADDAYVSNAQAYSGANSVVIAQNNDLVKTFGQLTTGKWKMSFQVYIPTGQAGYFNTLAGFTPNPFNWGMECYFDAGGGGRLLGGSATAVAFSWTADTWQLVEVVVDLDNDMAEFHFNGSQIHSWTWTAGASGGGSPLQLDANDFYGATANDEMYFDDYAIEEVPVVGIGNNEVQLPEEFALFQNYPNPFNPATTITYSLKENARVNLKVYNSLGQLVKTLVNANQEAGLQNVQWDGTNDVGAKVSSGIYIYRLEANDFAEAKKMILMK